MAWQIPFMRGFISLVIFAFLVPISQEHLINSLMNDKLKTSFVDADSRRTASVGSGRCYLEPDKWGRFHSPLPELVKNIAENELSACVPSLIFDPSLPTVGNRDDIYAILNAFPIPVLIGRLLEPTAPSWIPKPALHRTFRNHPGKWHDIIGNHDWKCRSYLLILDDVMSAAKLIRNITKERVVVVTRSPLWRIRDFLSGPEARHTLNLLIVQDQNWKRIDQKQGFADNNLMTHRVFGDSLGGSFPQILTSWRCDHFTRPWVRLFPAKMLEGFSGHQFKVAAVDSPPFVYKMTTAELESSWDGYEVRIISLLADLLNFTPDFREPVLETEDRSSMLAATRVVREVLSGSSEVGVGGVYITTERLEILDMPQQHTQDCASFMTLASIALPRYRAILGPFQWTVWLAVSLAYILAIVPLVFSHHLSVRLLIRHPEQIENMFWYVFGTFTNLFQFKGEDTWVGSKRDSTRMIIGWYWAFSIIITACYTGSVISFIAFPVFPSLVENIMDVIEGGYRVGTLSGGGWNTWFLNSSDPNTNKLMKKVDLVPTVWDGIQNMTHASFFHPYSFVGSRLYLEHVVRTNYSAENKRSLVHISEECFVPFWVSMIFPRDAIYSERFSHMILRADQSGLIEREKRNVRWDTQRTSTGSLLQASSGSTLRTVSSQERMLTLDDTQGMFLLLGVGVLMAVCALSVENIIGRVSSLRERCPPGPRRMSSAGVDPAWLAGSRASTTSGFETQERPRRPSKCRYRRSVNSLPGNMLEQTEYVVKGRSMSIATAPPIVLNENRTDSIDDLDEAACLQTTDESEEAAIAEDPVRSLSIFSWVSALAARFNFRRESQSDRFLDSESSFDTGDTGSRDQSQDSDPSDKEPKSSPTKTYTVDQTFGNVDSIFGNRHIVEESQEAEPSRLSSLELLKPLKKMEAEECFGEAPAEEVQFEMSNVNINNEQSNVKIEQATNVPSIEIVSEDISQSESQGICGPLCTEEADKKQAQTESSTKVHRRKPSTLTRTQTMSELKKKTLQVPRTSRK